MVIPNEIVIGVVSGVLTATGLYLAKEFWTKTIVPSYQSIKYQGADISGVWLAELVDNEGTENEATSSFSMVLKQNAHKITGSMQFTHSAPSNTYTIDFNINGEYWEGYLNLMCRSKSRKTYSHASLFLKLAAGGLALEGQFSFRNVITDTVSSDPLVLIRN